VGDVRLARGRFSVVPVDAHIATEIPTSRTVLALRWSVMALSA